MKKRLNSLIFAFVFASISVIAQEKINIQGTVVDEQSAPLVGATIVEKGKSNGVITNIDGKFSLTVNKGSVLRISYVGYKEKDIVITQVSPLFIQLTSENILENIVVVGYGVQKKETVTGAIGTVKGADLLQSPVANISNSLVGRVTGITSTQASGEPGKNSTTLRLRGLSTINTQSQEPLIVIDGIQSTTEVLDAMDPYEVENMSVLKDASATAIYGVKGANGVIIVTTKRGTNDKPKINLSYNFGITHLATRLKMLNAYDYALYRNEAILNDKDPAMQKYLFSETDLWKFKNNRDYTPEEVNAMSLPDNQKQALLNAPAIYYKSHDYFKELFGGSAPQHQINLNVSGGNKDVRYFTSIGYFSQDGVFKNTDYHHADVNSFYKRYNLRTNFDFNFSKRWNLKVDIAAIFTNGGGILGSSSDGDITQPYARHKAMLGAIMANPPFAGPGIIDNHLVGHYVDTTSPLLNKGISGWSPMTNLLTRPYLLTSQSNLNTNISLRHDLTYLTPGLSLTGKVSYNDVYFKSTYRQNSVPIYSVTRNPSNPNKLLFFGGDLNPSSVKDNYGNNKWRRIYLEINTNYERKFGKHAVTALYLVNAQKTYDPHLQFNVPAGLIGMAGRLTYRYDDKYLAEVNIGYNGSENFPKGKRFGFFPAFSVGWIVTNEQFIPQNDILNYMKIRASYGEVGNDQVGGRRFLYLPSTWGYGSDNYINGYYLGNTNGSTKDPYYHGAWETSVGNPNVTWERARKTNLGIEINMFKNRLTFVGDIFYEKRDNILWVPGVVPGLVGAELPPANIGKVSNKGYEIQLGWRDKNKDFSYSVLFNVSYAKNTIKYIAEPPYPYPWMNATGYSIGQYRGYLSNGFYNTEEELRLRPYTTVDGNKAQLGDIKFIDINGDGILDTKDIVPIGYSNYPRYTFSSTLNIVYKGFGLSLLFTGSAQGSMPLTDLYIRNPFYMGGGTAMQFQYDDRWTLEKIKRGIMPTFPRASTRTNSTINGLMSDFWLLSTDHIKLKNIELSYTLQNVKLIKRYSINSIRMYVNCNNLLSLSKMIPGIDPEQQDSGGASGGYVYPMTRIINFGMNIQF